MYVFYFYAPPCTTLQVNSVATEWDVRSLCWEFA